MIANRGTLKAFQDGILADLQAQSLFGTIAIVCADDGDLATLLDQALLGIQSNGGKIGAYIIIHQPSGHVENREVQEFNAGTGEYYKPYIKAECWLAIVEMFPENRDPDVGTGIPALTLAEAVMQTLHRPVSSANPLPRYTDGPFPIAPEIRDDKTPDTSKIGYQVKVETEGWATALDANAITLVP